MRCISAISSSLRRRSSFGHGASRFALPYGPRSCPLGSSSLLLLMMQHVADNLFEIIISSFDGMSFTYGLHD